MAWRPIFTITIGVAGAGKTFARVCWLVEKFLPHETGTLYTNLPLNPEAIAEYCKKKHGSDPHKILKRIKKIPPERLSEWEQQQGGPWEFFEGKPVAGHIIIDEAHRVCSAQQEKDWGQQWQKWIGELRHVHGSVEFVTQAENKLPPVMRQEAERTIFIESDEGRRDWFFKIENAYWYQLWAKLRGKYAPMTIATEYKLAGKKQEKIDETAYVRRPEIFALYQSYSAPGHEGEALGKPIMEYERMSWPRFLFWFCLQNPKQLSQKLFIIVVMVWLVLGGGWGWIVEKFMAGARGLGETQAASLAAKAGTLGPDGKPVAKPKPVDQPTPAPGYEEHGDMVATSKRIDDARRSVMRSQAIAEGQKADAIQQLEGALQAYRDAYWRAAEVVSVAGDTIILRDGSRYKFGEPIQDGKLKGRTVTHFNRKAGLLELDNGDVLKLGGVPESPPPGQSPAHVAERLQNGRPGVSNPVPRDPRGAAYTEGSYVPGPRDPRRSGSGAAVPAGPSGGALGNQPRGGPRPAGPPRRAALVPRDVGADVVGGRADAGG
jgi:hypothetical protein